MRLVLSSLPSSAASPRQSRPLRRTPARVVLNSQSQPTEETCKQALGQLVAKLASGGYSKKNLAAAIQDANQVRPAFCADSGYSRCCLKPAHAAYAPMLLLIFALLPHLQATVYQTSLEERVSSERKLLEERTSALQREISLLNEAHAERVKRNDEQVKRLEAEATSMRFRAMQAEGQNDPRGLFGGCSCIHASVTSVTSNKSLPSKLSYVKVDLECCVVVLPCLLLPREFQLGTSLLQ